MLAALLALALAAPPYASPKLVPYTDKLKCDTGVVAAVDTKRSELRVTTPAGVVTYHAGADVQVLDAAGQPVGSPAKLQVGAKVRVYYVVDDGARAAEIDLE